MILRAPKVSKKTSLLSFNIDKKASRSVIEIIEDSKDLINEHVNGIWMLSIKHDVARDWDVNADGDQTIQGFAIPFSINKVIMLYFKVIKFSTTFFNRELYFTERPKLSF